MKKSQSLCLRPSSERKLNIANSSEILSSLQDDPNDGFVHRTRFESWLQGTGSSTGEAEDKVDIKKTVSPVGHQPQEEVESKSEAINGEITKEESKGMPTTVSPSVLDAGRKIWMEKVGLEKTQSIFAGLRPKRGQ